MKLTATFKDENEARLAMNGAKHYFFILNMDRTLRDILKYGHKFKSVEELAENLRSSIHKEIDMELVP